MKRILIVLTIMALIVIGFSCGGGNSTLEINCAECFVIEPDSFELEVQLTINSVYDSVYLEFFEGNVESGKPSWEGWVFTQFFYHLVPVDKYYSIKASYINDGKTIVAVDGDRMVSRFMVDACDVDCWIVKGNYLDVQLKY